VLQPADDGSDDWWTILLLRQFHVLCGQSVSVFRQCLEKVWLSNSVTPATCTPWQHIWADVERWRRQTWWAEWATRDESRDETVVVSELRSILRTRWRLACIGCVPAFLLSLHHDSVREAHRSSDLWRLYLSDGESVTAKTDMAAVAWTNFAHTC